MYVDPLLTTRVLCLADRKRIWGCIVNGLVVAYGIVEDGKILQNRHNKIIVNDELYIMMMDDFLTQNVMLIPAPFCPCRPLSRKKKYYFRLCLYVLCVSEQEWHL